MTTNEILKLAKAKPLATGPIIASKPAIQMTNKASNPKTVHIPETKSLGLGLWESLQNG